MSQSYQIDTDLPPDALNLVGTEIYRMWVEFAQGTGTLGGQTLKHPTGAYADSIEIKRNGPSSFTIFSNTQEAFGIDHDPIEEGHGAVDFIARWPGRVFKIPLGGPPGMPDAALSKQQRGEVRADKNYRGPGRYVRVPMNRTNVKKADAWIIPAMPAYAPAAHLATLIRNANSSGNWGALLR